MLDSAAILQWISEERARTGETQTEIAQRLGVQQSAISKWESRAGEPVDHADDRRTDIRFDTVVTIAERLQLPLLAFLEKVETDLQKGLLKRREGVKTAPVEPQHPQAASYGAGRPVSAVETPEGRELAQLRDFILKLSAVLAHAASPAEHGPVPGPRADETDGRRDPDPAMRSVPHS